MLTLSRRTDSRADLRSHLRRHAIVAAPLLVVPALVLSTPGTADAATTRDRADAAAGWLGRQLNPNSHVMEGQFGPDYGLTADTVIALDSAKVGRVAARQATYALTTNVLSYTGFGDPAEHYAGAYAKLLLVAVAQSIDPKAFGTGPRRNLVAGLRALQCGTAARTDCPAVDAGRFSDRSQYGDFSNAFGQSLGIIGLERGTKLGASPASVTFLLGQQCPNGGFPETFDDATCTSSVDATAFAVQALVTVGSTRARTAAADAGRFLLRRQKQNGSFIGNGVRNANTTALATQALTAVGRLKAAAEGQAFLRTLQVMCSGKPAQRGKVRYVKVGTGDTVRATSQAVPALAGSTLGEVAKDGSSADLPTLGC